jgi:hypothetical protein
MSNLNYYFNRWKTKFHNKKLWEQLATKHITDISKHEYDMPVPDECMLSDEKFRNWCIQSINK